AQATQPPPPPMLMTFTGTPSACAKYSAKMRALRSVPPPAGNGTTSSTGPDGNLSAAAPWPVIAKLETRPTAAKATAFKDLENFIVGEPPLVQCVAFYPCRSDLDPASGGLLLTARVRGYSTPV